MSSLFIVLLIEAPLFHSPLLFYVIIVILYRNDVRIWARDTGSRRISKAPANPTHAYMHSAFNSSLSTCVFGSYDNHVDDDDDFMRSEWVFVRETNGTCWFRWVCFRVDFQCFTFMLHVWVGYTDWTKGITDWCGWKKQRSALDWNVDVFVFALRCCCCCCSYHSLHVQCLQRYKNLHFVINLFFITGSIGTSEYAKRVHLYHYTYAQCA